MDVPLNNSLKIIVGAAIPDFTVIDLVCIDDIH